MSQHQSLLSRRAALRAGLTSAAGLGAAALVGCDSDDDESAPRATEPTGASSTAVSGAGRLVKDPSAPYPYEFPEPASAPKKGGTLIFGTSLTHAPADPTVNNTGATLNQISPVYDKLLSYKMGPEASSTQYEVVPELAQTWERSPDGLVMTFKLRSGVKWQAKPRSMAGHSSPQT